MTQIYLLTSDHQHAVCGTNFSPMQINFFAEEGYEEVTFDHVPGKEKDQVSPIFISEHQHKTSVRRFCKITQFFGVSFVISKVC